jgi:hypothetical protein
MSRTYNDYYFEKQDILDTLEKLDITPRLLNMIAREPQGIDNIKYLVERNANRKFNWFGEEMIQDIINNEEVR